MQGSGNGGAPMPDQALLEWRRGKDAAFAQEGQSPLEPDDRATFAGLRYFDPDEAYRFAVEVEPFSQPELVQMQTSTGDEATYERYGRVRFTAGGAEQTLTVFRSPGQDHLFLPFRDATAGDETYGAGRYVEIVPSQSGGLVLDFNYAYNPFCAYSPHWVCPIPPAENALPVPIRAGERSYR